MKVDFEKLGAKIGALVAEKNRAYGDSINAVAVALKELFPDGIPVEKYRDLGLLVRVWDKMKRIATEKDAFEENPWKDIAGYGILGTAEHLKGHS